MKQTEKISKTIIPFSYAQTFKIELCNVRGKEVVYLNNKGKIIKNLKL